MSRSNKSKLQLLFILLCVGVSCFGSPKIPGDSLAADFRFFCDMLEKSHPDPYTSFGGRPCFRLVRNHTAERIASDSMTVREFCDVLNGFIAPLKDMHTYVQYPRSGATTDIRFAQRIAFTVLNDGLLVSGIAKPYSEYLGANLLSIGGVPLDSLVRRMAGVKAHENRFGNLNNLALWCNQNLVLSQLGVDFDDHVCYELKTFRSDTVRIRLPLVERNRLPEVELARLPSRLKLPDGNLGYGFLDKRKRVMYFRLSSIMARENYRYCYDNGWNNALNDISGYYRSIGKEMPEKIDDAIDGIPSFSEEFSAMLRQMKERGSEYLIIDLRGNGGGWTPITLPSLMMMFGDEYYGKDFDVKMIRLLSELYLQKLNMTLDEVNRAWNTRFEIGDCYIMNGSGEEGEEIAAIRESTIRNALTETRELLTSLNGAPLYRPKRIFVITDARTFSAAFHYAFYLFRMGATLVGVPSRQAPNTFMETTPLKLPHTGLTASISNTMQLFFPADSPFSKELTTDIGITSQDYRDFDNDADTPVMKILKICASETGRAK